MIDYLCVFLVGYGVKLPFLKYNLIICRTGKKNEGGTDGVNCSKFQFNSQWISY
jgi:hypothetical protein